MGQLKRAVYARLEEVSFRSGAAAAGGVLTAAGVAITLAVVLGGGPGDTVTSAPAARAATPSVASPVPASSSPQGTPWPSRTTVPVTVAGDYRPPSSPARAPAARASAARYAATTGVPGSTFIPRPFDRRWRPGHRHPGEQPGRWGWHQPRHRRR